MSLIGKSIVSILTPLALILIAASSIANGEPSRDNITLTITIPDTGAAIPITVKPGSTFSFTLASNSTTGYKWRIAGTLPEKVVSLVGSTYNEPKSNLVGRGGSETWTFKAKAKGTATIKMEYVRPWEKDIKPDKTQTFSVTVK